MNLSRKTKVTLAALAGAVAALSLQAQTAAPAPAAASDDNSTQVMEQFIVTGSNIENAGAARTAAGVRSWPCADIENSGVETNVLDVLRKISPSVSGLGGENATTSGGATNGGSQVSLHNLPTLVLVAWAAPGVRPRYRRSGGNEFVDREHDPPGSSRRRDRDPE